MERRRAPGSALALSGAPSRTMRPGSSFETRRSRAPPAATAKPLRRDEVGSCWKGYKTMFEKGLLAGKRILVTGGGSGLGAAMGRRFVELGAELIICGRRLELLEVTAAKMRSDFGGKVTTVKCDIRDGAAVDAMMDALFREAPIDVLVNNAA